MSSNTDEYEEQIKMAEELSFLDEYELYWDPTHLEDTKDRVKRYENIVNEQLFLMEDEGAPLADAQIRDLFFSSLDSDKMISEDSNVKPAEYSPTVSERISATREQKLKETVDSIRRSLRWYQGKIVKQIQSTNEVRNAMDCVYLIFIFLLWSSNRK
jgi:hypothetical protein